MVKVEQVADDRESAPSLSVDGVEDATMNTPLQIMPTPHIP